MAGTRRRLLLWLLLLAAAQLLLLLAAASTPAASPAAAEPPPGCNPNIPPPLLPPGDPGCPPPGGPAPGPPLLPVPPPPCDFIGPVPPGTPPCEGAPADPPPGTPEPADPPSQGQPAASSGGAVGELFGEDGQSLSGYDIGYDEGAWNDFSRKFWGGLTQLVWSGVTGVIGFCTWLIDWVFDFAIVDYLTEPVTDVAAWWHEEVVERLGLPAVLLMLAIAVAGFHLLRGRTGHGIRDGFTSVVIAAIAAIVLIDPASYLLGDDGLLGQTEELSLEVAQITLGEEPVAGDDGASVAEPINASLVDGFVTQPHQVINWGSVLADQPGCLAVSEEMVATGPHGAADDPRNAMNDAGCENEFAFNEIPSSDRLFGAFLVLIAALVMTALIVLVCFSVAAVQVGFAVMTCLAVFALVAGILPGPGRAALWQWVTFAAKLLAALLAAVVFLALMLVLIQGLLGAGDDDSLMGRLAALNALVICGFVFRKRLFAAADRAAVRISNKAAAATAGNSRSGGSGGMLGAGSTTSSGSRAGGGANSAAALWRENNAEVRRTAAPLRSAGHHAAGTGRSAQRVIRPAEDGTTRAQRLHTELSRTRTGRAALHGAKGTHVAGKAAKMATAWTLGAPVTLPRAGRKAAAASKAGGHKVKAELDARAEAARSYGREWAHNAAAPFTAAARFGSRRTRRPSQPDGPDGGTGPSAGTQPPGPGAGPSGPGGAGPRPSGGPRPNTSKTGPTGGPGPGAGPRGSSSARPSTGRVPNSKTPPPDRGPGAPTSSRASAGARPPGGPRTTAAAPPSKSSPRPSPTGATAGSPAAGPSGPREAKPAVGPPTSRSSQRPRPTAAGQPASRKPAAPAPARAPSAEPPPRPAAPPGQPGPASTRRAATSDRRESAAGRAARLRAKLPPTAPAAAAPVRPPMNGPR